MGGNFLPGKDGGQLIVDPITTSLQVGYQSAPANDGRKLLQLVSVGFQGFQYQLLPIFQLVGNSGKGSQFLPGMFDILNEYGLFIFVKGYFG